MTTGRINQVTADYDQRRTRRVAEPPHTMAVSWIVWIAASDDWWSRMRPRMGFALVRISHHTGVSTHRSANEARLERGAADCGHSLHQHIC